MILVAGLGNPGKQYESTRHNIGFQVVSALAEKHNISGKQVNKFNAITGAGTVCGVDTIIVEPLTFMNLSGEAILKILNWYKIDPGKMIIIYDDIDLNLGRLRFRPEGSDGGHNGIKSIIGVLGGRQNFARLRVGIGPGPGGSLRRNFVLTPFAREQQPLLKDSVNLAVEALELFLKEGVQSAMNKYNGIDLTKPQTQTKKKSRIFFDKSITMLEKEPLVLEFTDQQECKNTIFPVNLLDLKKGEHGG